MYEGDPIAVPTFVTLGISRSIDPGLLGSPTADGGASSSAFIPRVFTKPKSATFTIPSTLSMRLSGLMSRWTMPRSWANFNPRAACRMYPTAS